MRHAFAIVRRLEKEGHGMGLWIVLEQGLVKHAGDLVLESRRNYGGLPQSSAPKMDGDFGGEFP